MLESIFMSWRYRETEFVETPKGIEGFVYLIINLTNDRKYIGKKSFWSRRKDKKTGRRKTKESNWKKYYGSCPELKDDVKKYGKEFFSREILSLHITKGTCNFEETKQLFLNNVLSESLDNGCPAYYNSNILGRYMRKDYGNFRTNSMGNP